MSDYWIVSSYKFMRHGSAGAAEAQRKRLSAQFPKKTFSVHHCEVAPPADAEACEKAEAAE